MYSNMICIICLEKADFACSGKCRRHFCKSCFTSPGIQSILQVTSIASQQQFTDDVKPATFTCIHCSRGHNICYYCFLPTFKEDFVCKNDSCNISAHLKCLMNLHKQTTAPTCCPLHTCIICNSGKQDLLIRNRARRLSESFMLTCTRCLKTAHLVCNNSHPIFQMIRFSHSSIGQAPACSVICRQCRMQIDSSLGTLNNLSNFLQKYKKFRLNELIVLYKKNNPDILPPLSQKKVDTILSSCEPYPTEMFWNKYMALSGALQTSITVTFSNMGPQVTQCVNEQKDHVQHADDKII